MPDWDGQPWCDGITLEGSGSTHMCWTKQENAFKTQKAITWDNLLESLYTQHLPKVWNKLSLNGTAWRNQLCSDVRTASGLEIRRPRSFWALNSLISAKKCKITERCYFKSKLNTNRTVQILRVFQMVHLLHTEFFKTSYKVWNLTAERHCGATCFLCAVVTPGSEKATSDRGDLTEMQLVCRIRSSIKKYRRASGCKCV